ncbi:MAG: hypothetical protein ACKVX7_04080 [Planctomycetota bacterium]
MVRNLASICVFVGLCSAAGLLSAQPAGTTTGRDIIVGDLQSVANWGASGSITAFSVGTTSCNIGTVAVPWVSSTNQHPVIGQNMYRHKDGVMEQIGQSWLKHGFFALAQTLCSGAGGCTGPSGSDLDPGCSDPYTASRNGEQSNLGPRSQVNAATGVFPYPWSAPPYTGVIARRLQVNNDDLNPTLNPGALYYVTGHYISSADAADNNNDNNTSYRRINVNGTTSYTIALTGGQTTQRRKNPIEAWQAVNADVEIDNIDVPGDGRLVVGTRVISLGGGQYQYEYAIFNFNSDRSVGAFTVDVPAGTSFLSSAFHDVFSHSGEPYATTDWTITPGAANIVWATQTHAANPNANAVRWDTMYNFRFTTNQPPMDGNATIGLFKPGTPSTVNFTTRVPQPGGPISLPVTNLACSFDGVNDEVDLSWNNPSASYTSITINRDGALLATLGGSATSYSDVTAAPGNRTYDVFTHTGALTSIATSCTVNVPVPPIEFEFEVPNTTITFTQSTGIGSGNVMLRIGELAGSPGFPHAAAGFSTSFSFDPNYLVAVTAVPASGMPALDFFAPAMFTNGMTIGAIVDFLQVETINFVPQRDVALCGFATVPTLLAGDALPTNTTIYFEDGVHGGLPIDNLVVVGTTSYSPNFNDGVIQLLPGSGVGLFIRGDVNADGSINIADPIANLDMLFSGVPVNCEKANDANDDGAIDIADPVYSLSYQFSSGPAMPSPFPGCGNDPTADSLDCTGATDCP